MDERFIKMRGQHETRRQLETAESCLTEIMAGTASNPKSSCETLFRELAKTRKTLRYLFGEAFPDSDEYSGKKEEELRKIVHEKALNIHLDRAKASFAELTSPDSKISTPEATANNIKQNLIKADKTHETADSSRLCDGKLTNEEVDAKISEWVKFHYLKNAQEDSQRLTSNPDYIKNPETLRGRIERQLEQAGHKGEYEQLFPDEVLDRRSAHFKLIDAEKASHLTRATSLWSEFKAGADDPKHEENNCYKETLELIKMHLDDSGNAGKFELLEGKSGHAAHEKATRLISDLLKQYQENNTPKEPDSPETHAQAIEGELPSSAQSR